LVVAVVAVLAMAVAVAVECTTTLLNFFLQEH
jgi:hypothetical protein